MLRPEPCVLFVCFKHREHVVGKVLHWRSVDWSYGRRPVVPPPCRFLCLGSVINISIRIKCLMGGSGDSAVTEKTVQVGCDWE